ncbi:hypothetical protein [Pseudomonas sp. TSRC2-2]|uniref:hypothetical protein n=2 Tax=unclassified Pseudomonas TaxID=196821 RepID=UPI003CE7FCC4
MNANQALIVVQRLLINAGSRLKLRLVSHAGADYWSFSVVGRGRMGKKVIVPFIQVTDGFRILGILDQTGRNAHWLFNGQAGEGCRQIAHYGDQGRTVVYHSRQYLTEWYGKSVGGAGLSIACQEIIACAPDRETLVLRDLEYERDDQRIELPSTSQADVVHQCLDGKIVSVQVEHYERLIKEFGVAVRFGSGEYRGQLMSIDTFKVLLAGQFMAA